MPIPDEPKGDLASQSSLEVKVSDRIAVSQWVSGIVVWSAAGLLDVAFDLKESGQYSLAIIIVQTACEVATERCISAAFEAKGLGEVEEAVSDLLSTYNLASQRNQRFYTKFTGDNIQRQRFWSAFKKAARRRHRAVHQGVVVGAAAAQESYEAGKALVDYLDAREREWRAT